MLHPKQRRTLLIINLLGVYILLQVCWWGYLLASARQRMAADDGEAASGIWMVVGEGTVFVLLLFIGFWQIRRHVLQELRFAHMQQTFLLAVTHELKTPVAAVKLGLETLRTRALSAEQAAQVAGNAWKEINRLEALTSNILLTTRIEQVRQDGFREDVDLSGLLRAECDRFSRMLANPQRIVSYVEPGIHLGGESELIRSLCFNLLDNAVKYSPEGGIIRVELRREKDRAVLRISDEGPGIPVSEREQIFRKFYRLGDEATRTHKGTGLGLYIANSAARLHGGSLMVAENHPRGSVFIAELPLGHE